MIANASAAQLEARDRHRQMPAKSTVLKAVCLVLLAHLIVFVVVLYRKPPKAIEIQPPRSISIQLVAETEPTPAPTPPQPAVVRPAPVVPPRPVVRPQTKVVPVTQAPSTLSAQPPVPLQPPAPPAPPAPTAPPAVANAMPADTAPKSVEHLDCSMPTPTYPALSRRNGDTGTVTVQMTIDTDGRIENASVAHSSGFPRLDDAALEVVRQSHCNPQKENGQGIRATARKAFTFKLDE